ncbi:DHA2 family efflux MFS transporter permease subunit [Nocardia yunnanensis]|uniref:DHA2 family efflux MFS transporter permease subunit n=1 Tax=Nocardia yunnanensis TaxID=2382165 RepID=A0A386ZA58_9NOCA|nr:MFS transporter [Nocardia yunnanensis]AYF74053.1 DHA2 family efflux MFS transporter permease subunit [Nocardia yunnanensis]
MTASIRLSSGTGRWVLLATVLGSGMAMLDATVVNVALPRIGDEFGASMAGLQWTVNAYTLTLAGLILLGGSLGDRYGRKSVFLIGVVWFAVASALCGAAQDVSMLIAARALQGVGGALLTPGSLAIIQASFRPDERARAVGAWSGLGGVAGAIGPFLGGWLVEAAGWRWVFLLNVPLAAVVIAVTARHVPETRDTQAHGRFDVRGAVLAALCLAGVTYALTMAPEHDTGRILVWGSAVAGIAAAVGFVLVERRRSRPDADPSAMLPVDVFASRQFTAINIVTFVMYGAMSVVFFLLVLTLQVVSGFNPIAAGTAMLPVTVLMLLFSARSGALAQRIGPRLPITAGVLLAAAGMLLMTRIGVHTSYLRDVLPAALVFGLGLTLAVAPLTATVLATADERHAGVASGVNNAVARAAGLLSVAAIPPLAGLTGAAYTDPADFGHGFRLAIVTSAILMVAAAALTFLTVRDDALRTAPPACEPECRTFSAVAAPPLEPGHARAPGGAEPD